MANTGGGLIVIILSLTATIAQYIATPVLRSCHDLSIAGYDVDGEYRIDPDGPGKGLPPFPVYCDMTNEDYPATTMVFHDQMFHGVVPNGFEDAGEFRIPVTYEGGATVQQISNLADASRNCTQYLRVDCHHITMFWEGEPWGYWVSRDGSMMGNWGTPTGTLGCQCSLDQSCDDPEHQTCNCDANDEDWRKDYGDLTDKTTLPVTELRFGDTGSDKEKVIYKIGALKCWGMEQKSFASCDAWTAAGFTGEGDYLIQPPDGPAQVQRCNEQYLTNPPPVLRSCEELRLAGYTTNGDYLIDPDFSDSGLRPFVVYCDMESGTTIIGNDRQGPLLSNGFNDKGEHRIIVHYKGASLQQVIGLVDASENCQQYIGAECHDSHIFSGHRTRNVYTWWISRNGTKMQNWGTPTGTVGCPCSLTKEGCDRNKDLCNCDANDDIWRKDDGYLDDKGTLPVSQLRIGDTGGEDEVAIYTLGELKCTGIGAKVYTSCASLQEDGITGGGQYLIDSDGIEGGAPPSVVLCEGTTEITTKVVNCPNATRIVPYYVTVNSGNPEPMVTKSPSRPTQGKDCPKSCTEKTGKRPVKSNKAQYVGQTGAQTGISAAALHFIVFGIVLLVIIVIVVLVIVVLQWKRMKQMQHFALKSPEPAVECTRTEQNGRESVDSFSNLHFFNSNAEPSKSNEYQQAPLI